MRRWGLLFQLARDNIREDLELTMPVSAEPCLRGDTVFVDYAEAAILLMLRIVVSIQKQTMRVWYVFRYI